MDQSESSNPMSNIEQLKSDEDKALSAAARKDKLKVRTAKDVLPLLGQIIHSEQECVMVITLDGNNQVSSHQMVTMGLANQARIHPREVFKWAVRQNSMSIMVAHNHPSGNLEPREADLVATRRLNEAGKLLGIPLLDRLIVSTEGLVSLREMKPGCFT